MIPTIQIELTEADIKELQDNPRRYVEGRMNVDGKTYKGVALKLKGAAGSFQPVDQKPAWTVKPRQIQGRGSFPWTDEISPEQREGGSIVFASNPVRGNCAGRGSAGDSLQRMRL
jgi:hypothetical protein